MLDFANKFNEEINWCLFGTGPAMVKAFMEDKLDIGYMGLPPAIIGINSGAAIKCVAGGHIEGTIMVAKKKYRPINKFKNNMKDVLSQFIGKVIGVPSEGSIHDVIIRHYIKQNNLHNQISIKNYTQAEFIAVDMKKNLLEGGIGTPSLAAFTFSILDSHIIIPPFKLCPFNPSYGIFFHSNIIKNNPSIVKQFLKYHKKASYMLRNKRNKAAKMISKSFGIIDKRYISSILNISPKYCITLPEKYVDSTMKFVKVLFNLGYIDQLLKIDEIFDFQFINDIHPEKEHYSK